jgi:hypothetical protein
MPTFNKNVTNPYFMIVHALAAACFSFYMVNIVLWQRLLPILNRKPFTCTVCLSAWSGLLIGLLFGYKWQAFEIMFIAGVMGLMIDNGIKRYL